MTIKTQIVHLIDHRQDRSVTAPLGSGNISHTAGSVNISDFENFETVGTFFLVAVLDCILDS